MTSRNKLDQWSYFEERGLAERFECSWVEAPDYHTVVAALRAEEETLACDLNQIRTLDALVYDLLYGDGVTTAWATQRWYGEVIADPGSMLEPYLREAGPPTNIPEAVRSGNG